VPLQPAGQLSGADAVLKKMQQLHLLTKPQVMKMEAETATEIKEGQQSLLFYFSSV
jgi:hypothetical protein